MELTDDAQDYADGYRILVRAYQDATRRGSEQSQHGDSLRRGKEIFRRWIYRHYGSDFATGVDPFSFFEEMTESVGYKFMNALGVEDRDFAFAVLNRYSDAPRSGRSVLVKAIRAEVLLKGSR